MAEQRERKVYWRGWEEDLPDVIVDKIPGN